MIWNISPSHIEDRLFLYISFGLVIMEHAQNTFTHYTFAHFYLCKSDTDLYLKHIYTKCISWEFLVYVAYFSFLWNEWRERKKRSNCMVWFHTIPICQAIQFIFIFHLFVFFDHDLTAKIVPNWLLTPTSLYNLLNAPLEPPQAQK